MHFANEIALPALGGANACTACSTCSLTVGGARAATGACLIAAFTQHTLILRALCDKAVCAVLAAAWWVDPGVGKLGAVVGNTQVWRGTLRWRGQDKEDVRLCSVHAQRRAVMTTAATSAKPLKRIG